MAMAVAAASAGLSQMTITLGNDVRVSGFWINSKSDEVTIPRKRSAYCTEIHKNQQQHQTSHATLLSMPQPYG